MAQIDQQLARQLARSLVIHWADKGLPPRARNALAYAACRTPDDVLALGRAHFARLANCGPVTLAQIERAIGGWTKSSHGQIASSPSK
jgi:hypothetical protein